jgi:hypothetical protein
LLTGARIIVNLLNPEMLPGSSILNNASTMGLASQSTPFALLNMIASLPRQIDLALSLGSFSASLISRVLGLLRHQLRPIHVQVSTQT